MSDKSDKAKTDSFRYSKLIPFAHVEGDASTTSVLWVLCSMARGKANKDYAEGTCDPSIPFIAAKTGLSTDTVMRCISKLTGLRLISKQKRGTVGHNRSNMYKLEYDALKSLMLVCDTADKEFIATIKKRDATKQQSRRRMNVTPVGASDTTEPVTGTIENVTGKLDACHPQTGGMSLANGANVTRMVPSGTTLELRKELLGTTKELAGSLEPEKILGKHPAARDDSQNGKPLVPTLVACDNKIADLKEKRRRAVDSGRLRVVEVIDEQLAELQA